MGWGHTGARMGDADKAPIISRPHWDSFPMLSLTIPLYHSATPSDISGLRMSILETSHVTPFGHKAIFLHFDRSDSHSRISQYLTLGQPVTGGPPAGTLGVCEGGGGPKHI